MYSGLCMCVLLAVLSASSLGQQTAGSRDGNALAAELEQSLTERHRPVRAPSSAGPLKPGPRLDGGIDQRANIGALLAKYLQQARKGTGPSGRISVMGNRVQSFDPTHRINDRDYMGWMDFGRRSAEEYEYSS
ncbi:CCKN protein, partial [Nothocercus nigrocapillus]|nr:CCKN protein [Nothocercus nigrocapillus]